MNTVNIVGNVVIILAGFLLLALLIWMDYKKDKSIEEERHKLQEEIKDLPLDVQVTLLSAQIRDEARRDWP